MPGVVVSLAPVLIKVISNNVTESGEKVYEDEKFFQAWKVVSFFLDTRKKEKRCSQGGSITWVNEALAKHYILMNFLLSSYSYYVLAYLFFIIISWLITDTYIIQHKMRIYELCNVSEPNAKDSLIRIKRPKKIGINARAKEHKSESKKKFWRQFKKKSEGK